MVTYRNIITEQVIEIEIYKSNKYLNSSKWELMGIDNIARVVMLNKNGEDEFLHYAEYLDAVKSIVGYSNLRVEKISLEDYKLQIQLYDKSLLGKIKRFIYSLPFV